MKYPRQLRNTIKVRGVLGVVGLLRGASRVIRQLHWWLGGW